MADHGKKLISSGDYGIGMISLADEVIVRGLPFDFEKAG
jgi:hypothetical protein